MVTFDSYAGEPEVSQFINPVSCESTALQQAQIASERIEPLSCSTTIVLTVQAHKVSSYPDEHELETCCRWTRSRRRFCTRQRFPPLRLTFHAPGCFGSHLFVSIPGGMTATVCRRLMREAIERTSCGPRDLKNRAVSPLESFPLLLLQYEYPDDCPRECKDNRKLVTARPF